MAISMTSKTGKAYQALVVDGKAMTAAEAKKELGIGNMRAEVTRLRQEGFAIYANTRKTKTGTVTEYRHGKASRKIIAAGYKAIALGLA
jgi:predicted ArsR family transcriptional regulator